MNDEQARQLLKLAYEEAAKSPDTSTQIGAGLVGGTAGFIPGTLAHNGFTHGWVPTPSDLERPRKYELIEHAERSSIYKAALFGIETFNLTMVATWAACADCARAIVQSGITKLVRHYPPLDDATDRWLGSVTVGDRILKAGRVDVIDVIGLIPGAPKILRGGEWFDPSS